MELNSFYDDGKWHWNCSICLPILLLAVVHWNKSKSTKRRDLWWYTTNLDCLSKIIYCESSSVLGEQAIWTNQPPSVSFLIMFLSINFYHLRDHTHVEHPSKGDQCSLDRLLLTRSRVGGRVQGDWGNSSKIRTWRLIENTCVRSGLGWREGVWGGLNQ